MGAVNITVLVNNVAAEALAAEHGFSLWIEADEKRILFDTGQGGALPVNAAALHLDLARTDMLVLSHGHYDHTGGIPHVLQQAPEVQVYGHAELVRQRHTVRPEDTRFIGMPPESRQALEVLPEEQKHWLHQPTMISANVGITGPIPRLTPYEDTGGPFFLDPDGMHADPLTDDLALWIRTRTGLIVCVGCSHAGIVNTLEYILKLNEDMRLRCILGGFHLVNAGPERLRQTTERLMQYAPDLLLPCHCSGDAALESFAPVLPSGVQPVLAGSAFSFS